MRQPRPRSPQDHRHSPVTGHTLQSPCWTCAGCLITTTRAHLPAMRAFPHGAVGCATDGAVIRGGLAWRRPSHGRGPAAPLYTALLWRGGKAARPCRQQLAMAAGWVRWEAAGGYAWPCGGTPDLAGVEASCGANGRKLGKVLSASLHAVLRVTARGSERVTARHCWEWASGMHSWADEAAATWCLSFVGGRCIWRHACWPAPCPGLELLMCWDGQYGAAAVCCLPVRLPT